VSATKTVKCLVWDLDHTLWDGILLEDREVTLRHGVRETLETLDARGILHSIASRNDHEAAMAKLSELGLAEYFLCPQIHWGSKVGSLESIAKALNLGVDALAFVDDQPVERDEVMASLPDVTCFDAADLAQITSLPELTPRFVTEDSRKRRQMYLSEATRKRAEEAHQGSPEAFLASLGMHLIIAPAQEQDLERAEELTLRTNQLNTTGYTYSHDELAALRRSPQHTLLIASLADKYGSYGKIGLSLLELEPSAWTIKLLLVSCRVMSRGIGSVLLAHLLCSAKAHGVRLRASPTSSRASARLGGAARRSCSRATCRGSSPSPAT
jgi:FkbH-like protein